MDGIRYIGYHWASGYELSDIDEASPLLNFGFYSIEVFPPAYCVVPKFQRSETVNSIPVHIINIHMY